ncbi:hypothetical protein HK101_010036 [Irineochytrium annulatum]|nr:hypothetical protein HK101_010036 [Irineochytrium annulatum]
MLPSSTLLRRHFVLPKTPSPHSESTWKPLLDLRHSVINAVKLKEWGCFHSDPSDAPMPLLPYLLYHPAVLPSIINNSAHLKIWDALASAACFPVALLQALRLDRPIGLFPPATTCSGLDRYLSLVHALMYFRPPRESAGWAAVRRMREFGEVVSYLKPTGEDGNEVESLISVGFLQNPHLTDACAEALLDTVSACLKDCAMRLAAAYPPEVEAVAKARGLLSLFKPTLAKAALVDFSRRLYEVNDFLKFMKRLGDTPVDGKMEDDS